MNDFVLVFLFSVFIFVLLTFGSFVLEHFGEIAVIMIFVWLIYVVKRRY